MAKFLTEDEVRDSDKFIQVKYIDSVGYEPKFESEVDSLEKAADYRWPDFEDAVQSATAERLRADCIITRNVRDFSGSRIAAFTPSEYLARYYS